MYFKKKLVFVLLSPLLFFSGQDFQNTSDLFLAQTDQGRTEYRVVVKVIGDEWRVVLEGDDSKSDVRLRRGDRIRWVVEGSDASFAFPDSRIFGHESREVRAGNPLVMAVSANSPKGTFAYSVFIHESMTYARGQSPPRIIVTN
jgi:plastocyanin